MLQQNVKKELKFWKAEFVIKNGYFELSNLFFKLEQREFNTFNLRSHNPVLKTLATLFFEETCNLKTYLIGTMKNVP